MPDYRTPMIAACVFCGAIASGQYSTVEVQQTLADPGTSSSRFGHRVVATKKSIYVAAPGFDRHPTIANSGGLFRYDRKTLAPLEPHLFGFEDNTEGGFGAFATKSEILAGRPGIWRGSHPGVGQAVYRKEKTNSGGYVENWAAGPNDRFGAALAITKRWLVIGAPGDVGGPQSYVSGSAFVSLKKEPFQAIRLDLPSYADGDEAGFAVAATNKVIAVGAPGTAGNLGGPVEDTGAVHLYDAKTLNYLRSITATPLFGGPRLGSALLFSGKSLFVGAPKASYGSFLSPDYVPGCGAVYEYNIKDWSLVRTYYSAIRQTGAEFGSSLAADKKNLLVGSPGFGDNHGRAELISRATGELVRRFVSPNPAENEQYGTSVIILDKRRVAVGAPAENTTTRDGTLYVHTFNM